MRTGFTRDRALALAGLAALFVVGAVCLTLLMGAGTEKDGGSEVAAATSTPTPTPTRAPARTPGPTPTPEPTPAPLTAEEREQRSAAAEQVRAQGFEPVLLRAYRPEHTLRVILGERGPAAAASVGGAPGRRAFFFVGDAYIGTDVQDVSSELSIQRQARRTVTLRYRLASGGPVSVRFRWDGTSLTPQTPVPPFAQRRIPA